jgi:predicted Zn-dependent protease
LPSYQFILADEELAGLVGNSDAAKGKELLLEMKKVKALDQIVENGRIQQDEFDRLFDVGVLAAAAEALAAAATATPAASDAAPEAAPAADAAEAPAADAVAAPPADAAAAAAAEAEAAAAPE